MVMHKKLDGKLKMLGTGPGPKQFQWGFDARTIHPDCKIVPGAIMDRLHTLLLKEFEPGAWRADVLAHPAHPSYPEPDSWYPLLAVGDHIPIERMDGIPAGIAIVEAIDYEVVTSTETPVVITCQFNIVDPDSRFTAEIAKVWGSGVLQKCWGHNMDIPNRLALYEALLMMIEGHPLQITGQFREDLVTDKYYVQFDERVDINGLADRCLWMMQQLDRVERLHDKLPHGSGINANWAYEVRYGYDHVRCSNTFSPMNDVGVYMNDIPFHFLVDANDRPILTRGGNIAVCSNRHGTRDAVDDALLEALS